MRGLWDRFERIRACMLNRKRMVASVKVFAAIVMFPFVFVGLGLARGAVLGLPFPWLSRRFGKSMGAVALAPLATTSETRIAALIGRTIRATALSTPWQSNCLAQALLARCLLGVLRIPYAMHLGMRSRQDATGEAIAHAWVTAGRVFVTGGNGFANYAVVAVFVPARLVPEAMVVPPPSSSAIRGSRWRS